MEKKFYTQYVRPKKVLERGGGTMLVEKAGYIPPKIRIEQFIEAGKRLIAFRKEQFDFAPGEKIDESFSDPTRRPGFDMADASLLNQDLGDRLNQKAASQRAAKKEKADEIQDKSIQNDDSVQSDPEIKPE